MAEYKLEDEITFGQYSKKKGYHKNLTIQEVIDLDPEYLVWMCDNNEHFELHHRAMEALLDATMIWDEDDYDI